MTKLILTRHGQSVWNAENRFTGWVDVDLSDKGVLEAEKSGQIIVKEIESLNDNIAYCLKNSDAYIASGYNYTSKFD